MFKRYHLRFDSSEKLTVRVRLWALFTDYEHILILFAFFFALMFGYLAVTLLIRNPFDGGWVILAVPSLLCWGACYMLAMDIRPQRFWREHTFSKTNYKINGQLVANREDIKAIHILEKYIPTSEGGYYTYTLSIRIKHHHNQKQIIDVSSDSGLSLLELADTIADVLGVKIVYQKSRSP